MSKDCLPPHSTEPLSVPSDRGSARRRHVGSSCDSGGAGLTEGKPLMSQRGVSEARDDSGECASGFVKLKPMSGAGSSIGERLRAWLRVSGGAGGSSYWLTRIVILRFVAGIYCVAFLVALHQNSVLIGRDGLLPAHSYLAGIQSREPSLWGRLVHVPTLFWFFDWERGIDGLLWGAAALGLGLAGLVVLRGGASIFLMLALWALYQSIANVGQRWYSFGWESQLLETGFLAAFLCPLWGGLSPLPSHSPPSLVVLFAFRWLIFRIMLGAGLIKMRGDKCWRDLTCMNYHYETQPVPNPFSYYMHQEPLVMHKFETLTNHVVELLAPVLVLLSRRLRIVGGAMQILFQVVLIISGNLSFLNWLTIVPSLACFDDLTLSPLFSVQTRSRVAALQIDLRTANRSASKRIGSYMRGAFNAALGCLILYLSIPIVQNLLSSRQLMNSSFDPLRLVNTYGAFGSVTKKRTELIFQGTHSHSPENAEWQEYEFKCKPGNVMRRPCLISPYHYRLDWLLWFAAFQNYQQNPWVVHLVAKFLINDNNTMSLIAHNPFEGKALPRWVRVEHYSYKFTRLGHNNSASIASSGGAANAAWGEGSPWWVRRRIGSYLPPLSARSIQDYLQAMGWTLPLPPST